MYKQCKETAVLQLLEDFVPQTLYQGYACGPHCGTSVPHTFMHGYIPQMNIPDAATAFRYSIRTL